MQENGQKIDITKSSFYVFVARDEEEYGRYVDPLLTEPCGKPRMALLPSDRVVLVLPHAVVSGDRTIPMCDRVASAILAASGVDLTQMEEVSKSLHLLVDDAERVKLFVHWGGEGYHEKELGAMRDIEETIYSNWYICALSSQRPELWKVGTIPKVDADFRRLEQGSLYEVAKDELTNCIWRWFLPKKNRGKIGTIRSNVYSLLKKHLQMMERDMKEMNSKEDQWRGVALRSWKKMTKQADDKDGIVKMPLGEEIVALFVDLMGRKGFYV